MKKQILKMALFVALIATISSCKSVHQTMREPYSRVNLTKSDFTLSTQVSAEAKTVKILGIDWHRLFLNKTAVVEGSSSSINLASIPVIGSFVGGDKTASYALYELMSTNPGYDVIFYPQFETKVNRPALGLGFIVKTTRVKTTARLGKLNE